MTEQEKMKNGYLWDDDEENMALQAQAKKLVRQFNALPPEDTDGLRSFPNCSERSGKMSGLCRRLRLRLVNMFRLETVLMQT